MPTPAQYINHLKFIDGVIQRRTEGLTHEDCMKQLPFPGNCMNWNLGHLLVYRMEQLGVLDGVTAPDEAQWAIYGFGSEPLTDSDTALPLPTLLAGLEEASARLIEALQAAPEAKLQEVFNTEKGTTVDDHLLFYLIGHEQYHTGQLEPLRELALSRK